DNRYNAVARQADAANKLGCETFATADLQKPLGGHRISGLSDDLRSNDVSCAFQARKSGAGLAPSERSRRGSFRQKTTTEWAFQSSVASIIIDGLKSNSGER
ncbi:MAG: hypothetical protein ACRYG4_07785, partial [Janthinobacterium lividum]